MPRSRAPLPRARFALARLALASLAVVPGAVAVVAPGTARAQGAGSSWEEPSLEDALRSARLVVRGRVLGSVAEDAGSSRVVVERAIVGKPPAGDSLAFGNASAAADTASVLPPLGAGDDVILVLEEDASAAAGKPRWRLPTPTFGRFTVKGGRVQGTPRDSFMRVDMSAQDLEGFLANASAVAQGQKADVAWLTSARASLAALDATAASSVGPAHVALEALCLGAQESDAELALRYFGSDRPQLRISAARLLTRAGGARAASGLLRLAIGDAEPSVRTVATFAVATVKPTPEGAVRELASRVRDASAAPISLAPPGDPRRGELASNLSAILEALKVLGAEREATDAAVELLSRDDDDTLAVACFFLHRVRPINHLHLIAQRMREADSPFYEHANRAIADLLKKITNAPIGLERDRWLTYLAMNRDVYPASPPPPGKH